MKDNRISLIDGGEIFLTLYNSEKNRSEQFLIQCEQGRGSSCIVYRACVCVNDKIERPVLIKEFYPQKFSSLLQRRKADYALLFKNSDYKQSLIDEYWKEKCFFQSICEQQKSFYQQNAKESADELIEIQGQYQLGESYYIVMRAGSGFSWDKAEKNTESLHEILETILSVVCEIEVYHRAELLHCDIKPANIYIFRKTRQHVCLLDFGSVQKLSEGCLTGTENLSYSIRYAAPELLDIADIDDEDRQDYYSCITEKADLYSITAVLYEKLTGERREPNISDKEFQSILKQNLEMVWEQEKNGWLKNIRHIVIIELKNFLVWGLAREPENRIGLFEMKAELSKLLKLAEPQKFELSSECKVLHAVAGFVGRQRELEQLKIMLTQGKSIFIYGDGGLGKSELALKLAQDMKDNFDFYRVTFSGDLEQTILSLPTIPRSAQEIADLQESPEEQKEKKEELYQWKMECLRSYSAANVLIIDNFDVLPERENEIFHSQAYADLMSLNMRLIFTTRKHPMADAVCLPLKELSEEELLKVIRIYYKESGSTEILRELIQKGGYNTLVVELLAKSLEQSWGRLKPENILKIFSSVGVNDTSKQETLIYERICQLFNVSVLNESCKELMAQTSIFPTGGINASLCLNCHSESEQDKLRLLELNGWIRKTPNHLLTVHPLIQNVCRKELPQRDRACEKFLNAYEMQYLMLPHKNRLENQLQFVEMVSNAADFLSDPFGKYAEKAGALNYEVGRYLQALLYNQKLWNIYITQPDVESSRAISILDRVACCCLGLGRYDEAIYYETQGITVFKKFEGKEHPELANYYQNLGSIYKEYGNYQNAIIYYKQAERLYEKQDSEINAEKAHLYLNLCKLCEKLGNFEKSMEYGILALKFYEQFSDTLLFARLRASVYTTLGILKERSFKYEEALSYYDSAIVLYEAVYGKEHLITGNSYNDKGIALCNLERYEESLKYLEMSRKIKETVYGCHHPIVANTYQSFAELCRRTKDYQSALAWCKKAENIRIDFFGEKSLKTVKSYEIHAAILYEEGCYLEEALKYSLLAMMIYWNALENSYECDLNKPYSNPEIQYAFYNLYQIYLATGKKPENFNSWIEKELVDLENC